MNETSTHRAYPFLRLCIGFMLFLLLSTGLRAQDLKSISGTILNGRTNAPMPDVTVVVKGSKTGATTAANGLYTIRAKPGDVLVFSYAGYETHEETVPGSGTTVNYTLREGPSKLDEVV